MSDNDDHVMQLTLHQANIIVGLERLGACLSLFGVILIVVTYVFFKRLRTVPNTFILCASIANVGASVASIIGLNGVQYGTENPLCRAQAFLLEMCMQSDPWWSFAMAVNVYLVFFHSANPAAFRRHLWLYCVICYGGPMVPAIVCLYMKNDQKGPIYANATLWCWIGDNWDFVRLYSYYIPIWTCISLSVVIYIAVGYHVFHHRNQLRNITVGVRGKEISTGGTDTTLSNDKPTFYGTVTTEVRVTSDVCHTSPPNSQTASPMGPHPQECPWADEPFPTAITNKSVQEAHDKQREQQNASPPRRLNSLLRHHRNTKSDEEAALPVEPPAIYGANSPVSTAIHSGSTTIAAAYPLSSAHPQSCRLASHAYHPSQDDGCTRSSTVQVRQNSIPTTISSTPYKEPSIFARIGRVGHRFTKMLRRLDPVKLAYLRTSFVFAISVLVTWTPASINHVCAIVSPASVSFGMNIASAFVLPLQGVWNAIIYFTTSWSIVKEEWSGVRSRPQRSRCRSGDMEGNGLPDGGRLPGLPGFGGSLLVLNDIRLKGDARSARKRPHMRARSPMAHTRRPKRDLLDLDDDDLLFDDDGMRDYHHNLRYSQQGSRPIGSKERRAQPALPTIVAPASPHDSRTAVGTLRVAKGGHFDQ